MGGKASAPAAPDYLGAANTQAAASKELTNIQNYANRPVINTPFGSQSWGTQAVTDPATGQAVTQWTQNNTLAPGLQGALDDQIAIQGGRSDLANSFMGRVADEYSKPFDYQNLPQLTSANAPGNLSTGVKDYSAGLTTGFNFGGPQMSVNNMNSGLSFGTSQTPVNTNFDSMQGGLTRNVQPTSVNTNFDPLTGRIASTASNTNVQTGLNTSDNPALPQFDSSYRDTVANQLMQKMQPVHDYQQRQTEAKLSNMGFRPGTEGYNRELNNLAQRQAAERYNALDTAGNEAQRLYGMQMGTAQQAFNQDVTSGQFANQAAGQQFNQGLSANQFQNAAANQAFNQNLQATQAANAAAGQQFNQALGAGQFGNSATQQAYAQALGANQAANQAYGQQFNQGLAANQFQNQAMGQAYNQNLGAANFGNAAQQQNYNQNLGAAQFQNQALGQGAALDLANMNAQNNAIAQQYGLNQQYANAQNQLRQQAIAEQAQRRGMSLNEMNALLSGQQVSMPQMPSFVAAQQSQTPNILGATQSAYDAQLGAYNAQQAGANSLLGSAAQLGSAYMMSPFSFSDRRLKSNIKRVGTHAIGVGIYDYTMMGMPQRGVIAQEVQAVRPDLVKRHASGYLMVNYGGL